MRRDAVFVVCGVARSCDLEGVFGRTYMRSHNRAIWKGFLIAYMCDRMFVRFDPWRCRRAEEWLAISAFFSQIARSCDHRHGLYDVSLEEYTVLYCIYIYTAVRSVDIILLAKLLGTVQHIVRTVRTSCPDERPELEQMTKLDHIPKDSADQYVINVVSNLF
jgi:hypothetical protein